MEWSFEAWECPLWNRLCGSSLDFGLKGPQWCHSRILVMRFALAFLELGVLDDDATRSIGARNRYDKL